CCYFLLQTLRVFILLPAFMPICRVILKFERTKTLKLILALRIVRDIYNLLFPEMCPGCSVRLSPGERTICTVCRHRLPVTEYHLIRENPVEKIFYGRVKIEFATAFLLFRKKGVVQQLIHHLKYKGQSDIGIF